MAVCAHLPWSSEGNARAPPPLRGSDISVHFLKRPAGSQYLRGLMHDGVPQNAQNCTQWAWHHACRNPKDKDTPYCRRNPTSHTFRPVALCSHPCFADRPIRARGQAEEVTSYGGRSKSGAFLHLTSERH